MAIPSELFTYIIALTWPTFEKQRKNENVIAELLWLAQVLSDCSWQLSYSRFA